MRESDKGAKGDHRVVSDPIKERKDFIDHLKHNAPPKSSDEDSKQSPQQEGVKK